MLMKRAMGGQLPLIQAAMKLADEILAGRRLKNTGRRASGRSARHRQRQENVSAGGGGAVQKFREKLADEQELIGALANMVMEIYAMESCLLRAQKAAANKGEAASSAMIDAARVFIADAAERVDHEAKRAIAGVHEGDMLITSWPSSNASASAPPWIPSRSAAASPPPSKPRRYPSRAAEP